MIMYIMYQKIDYSGFVSRRDPTATFPSPFNHMATSSSNCKQQKDEIKTRPA